MGCGQVPLERFEPLPVIQADDVVAMHGFLRAYGRRQAPRHDLGSAELCDSGADAVYQFGQVGREDGIFVEIGCNDLRRYVRKPVYTVGQGTLLKDNPKAILELGMHRSTERGITVGARIWPDLRSRLGDLS